MFKLLAAFGIGWYFGRNPGAGQQLVSAGQQLLNSQTGQPVANTVLPNTTIISPEQAAGCQPGYVWWPQYGKCLDPGTDAKLRQMYNGGQQLPASM